jgi:hypothetical protein
MIVSEGSLERDFICRMQDDPEVTLRYQPVTIHYLYLPNGGPNDIELFIGEDVRPRPSLLDFPGVRRGVYTPDFLIEWSSGRRRLVEVKHSKQVGDPAVQRKKAVAEAYARHRGWEFAMYLDTDIRQEPGFTNAKIRRRYRRQAVPMNIEQAVLVAVSRGEGITVQELTALLTQHDRTVLLPCVYALVAKRKLWHDDNFPLGLGAQLFTPCRKAGTHDVSI